MNMNMLFYFNLKAKINNHNSMQNPYKENNKVMKLSNFMHSLN
jgi:hypothetical protein